MVVTADLSSFVLHLAPCARWILRPEALPAKQSMSTAHSNVNFRIHSQHHVYQRNPPIHRIPTKRAKWVFPALCFLGWGSSYPRLIHPTNQLRFRARLLALRELSRHLLAGPCSSFESYRGAERQTAGALGLSFARSELRRHGSACIVIQTAPGNAAGQKRPRICAAMWLEQHVPDRNTKYPGSSCNLSVSLVRVTRSAVKYPLQTKNSVKEKPRGIPSLALSSRPLGRMAEALHRGQLALVGVNAMESSEASSWFP